MWIRILSAVLGIPVIILVLYYGRTTLTIALTIVTLIGLKEFYGVFKKIAIKPFEMTGLISGALIIASTGLYGERATEIVPFVLIACIFICFSIMIFTGRTRITDLGVTLLGIVYVSIFMSLILLIYINEYGKLFIWLVFILAWAEDTFAYFIGINFGRHKLCPSISPKKSVEGAVGGLSGSVIGSLVFGFVAHRLSGISFKAVDIMVLGVIGGALAQLGDLSASLIKRYAGVKDYGNIIPGHGGILDRFDSILFTAPVVYYYIRLFL